MKRRIIALMLGLALVFSLASGAYAEETTDPVCTCGTEDGIHAEGCGLYEPQCTCEDPEGGHLSDCPLAAAQVPQEPQCTCGSQEDAHEEGCPLYREVPQENPECTCGSQAGAHEEGCPLYRKAPQDPYCTCGSQDGTHEEDCLRVTGILVTRDGDVVELTVKPGQRKNFIFEGGWPDAVTCEPSPHAVSYDAGSGIAEVSIPATAQAGTVYVLTAAYGDELQTIARVMAAGEDIPDPSQPDDALEDSLDFADGSIMNLSITGALPEGSQLVLSAADPADIAGEIKNEEDRALIANLPDCAQPYVAFDLSLRDQNQPEGTVQVKMKAERLGLKPGEGFVVYHIHEGVLNAPIFGRADGEGNVVFTVEDFSYIIVANGAAFISDVTKYYVATDLSGNQAHRAVGIYFKNNAQGQPETHLILAHNNSNSLKDIQSVQIDDTVITSFDITSYANLTSLQLTDDNGNVIYENLVDGFAGVDVIQDVNLGTGISVTGNFKLTVTTKQGSGGHGITEAEIVVELDYEVLKTVYSVDGKDPVDGTIKIDQTTVTAPQVGQGQYVVYKIVIHNRAAANGDIPNASFDDILPAGLFDTNEIYISSEDNPVWIKVSPDNNGKIHLGEDDNLACRESHTFFIRAKVSKSAKDGLYTNRATLMGDGIDVPGAGLADVIVNKQAPIPTTADLAVTKTVKVEVVKPETGIQMFALTVPDQEFEFTVTFTGASGSYTIRILDADGNQVGKDASISSGGTFKLKDGQTAKILNLPRGAQYSITETPAEGFTCNAADNTIKGDVLNPANFFNTYRIEEEALIGTLTISKEVKNKPAGQDPEFSFRFDTDAVGTFNTVKYTPGGASEGVPGFLKDKDIFTLKDGESLVVQGLPVDAVYSVLEIRIPEGYQCAASDDKISGTVSAGDASKAAFVNYYGEITEEPLGALIITKSGWDQTDENQSFVFCVKGTDEGNNHIDMTVVVHGAGSVKIKDLPAGNYIISEEFDWSWRYTASSGTVPAVVTGGETTNVTYQNSRTNSQWLNGSSYADNRWADGSIHRSN